MSAYYENQQQQWGSGAPQNSWDQTPPNRSATSSAAIPRENESNAFLSQFEEVDKAQDNLLKSGKVFAGMPGQRRESLPYQGPPRGRPHPVHDPRMGPGAGSRPHSAADFGEQRGQNNQSNLQNFYAAQRHQTSRGSNEAEQMMQAKRRMAAQRERELRNYHQEQQYNRNVLSDPTIQGTKPERALSPGSMSEDERRKLIARQRSALYGEGPYVDETGTPHPGLPGPPNGPASLRGHSPLAYEFGRTPPAFPQGGSQPPVDVGQSQPAGPIDPTRTNSTSSPQPNVTAQQQQAGLNSVSSPTGSPSLGSGASSKLGQGPAVAPIGTRPTQPTMQRSTPPVPSSLNQGFGTSDNDSSAGGQSNPSSAAEGRAGSLWGGRNNSVWGNNGSSGQQASVWGAA
ncbi:hypothetical protein CONLIGDRAFT_643345 [Coniochaeta ligniaria NRRL 30616]|uniref:Uncharacterized protein n=1 Tax=Coniochaeta ligniaria NRRL 30616 TaxID=1408157 RepID=A0A1J7JPU0_9PEZI|nr:hypothetical protein CONLIGDRAFT_643345 [Coniochaeta ligniaria NRRL 30616]